MLLPSVTDMPAETNREEPLPPFTEPDAAFLELLGIRF